MTRLEEVRVKGDEMRGGREGLSKIKREYPPLDIERHEALRAYLYETGTLSEAARACTLAKNAGWQVTVSAQR